MAFATTWASPMRDPPTGERRWRKPEVLSEDFSYEISGEARDCTDFGNICPQEIYILDGAPFNEVPAGKGQSPQGKRTDAASQG